MAAAGSEYYTGSSDSSEKLELSRNEKQLFKHVKYAVTERLGKRDRHSVEELDFEVTVLYSPTGTQHKCILNIIIPARYGSNPLFTIVKPGEDPCISIEYDTETEEFPSFGSSIEQNSRIKGEPRCFEPAIPFQLGAMTDFLQILSTKIKLRYGGSKQIEITDVAKIPGSNLPFFIYRFMRLYKTPSIYQKYGYKLVDSGYWDRLREHLQTLSAHELMSDTMIKDIPFKYLPKEEELAAIQSLKDLLGERYDDTKPLPDLLKEISYEVDAVGQISWPLFCRLRIFQYLLSYQAESKPTTQGFLADLEEATLVGIMEKDDSEIGNLLKNDLPLLKLDTTSDAWKHAEQTLIITDIQHIVEASGGARRKTVRKRVSRRKRRSSHRHKVDRVRA